MLHPLDVSSPVFVDTNMDNEIIEKESNSQFEFRCYTSGRPTPALAWYRDDKEIVTRPDSGIRTEDRGQRLVFARLLVKDSGVYECRVGNRGGAIERRTLLKVKGSDYEGSLQTGELLFTVILVVLGVSMLLLALFMGKRIREEKVTSEEPGDTLFIHLLTCNLFAFFSPTDGQT